MIGLAAGQLVSAGRKLRQTAVRFGYSQKTFAAERAHHRPSTALPKRLLLAS